MDFYGFYTGKIFDAYKYLGAHTEKQEVTFRTFAPSASRIALIGEFNDWQESDMNKVYDGNFWECYIPEAKAGQMYKYRIYDRNDNPVDHCDPYGFGMELRPNSASIVRDMTKYKFKDSPSGCRTAVTAAKNLSTSMRSISVLSASRPTRPTTGTTMKK